MCLHITISNRTRQHQDKPASRRKVSQAGTLIIPMPKGFLIHLKVLSNAGNSWFASRVFYSSKLSVGKSVSDFICTEKQRLPYQSEMPI